MSALRERSVAYDCFWDGRYGLATAFINGQEVGVLLFEERDGEISVNSIHVEEEFRRMGIATGMAKKAFEEASPQVKRSNGGELPSIFASLLTDYGKSLAISETLSQAVPELEVELRDTASS